MNKLYYVSWKINQDDHREGTIGPWKKKPTDKEVNAYLACYTGVLFEGENSWGYWNWEERKGSPYKDIYEDYKHFGKKGKTLFEEAKEIEDFKRG